MRIIMTLLVGGFRSITANSRITAIKEIYEKYHMPQLRGTGGADMILTKYGKYTILSSTTPANRPKTHRDLYREISKLPIFGSVQFDAEHGHRAMLYKANISKRKGIKLIHKWTDGILTITRVK
jgi:hypothetical protein